MIEASIESTKGESQDTASINFYERSTSVPTFTWKEIVTELDRTIDVDKDGLPEESSVSRRRQGPPPCLKHNINLYLKYLDILTKLDQIYNGMSHPQKREHIKGTQTLIIRRITELRNYFHHNPYWQRSTLKVESWEYVDLHSDVFSPELRFLWNSTRTPIPKFIEDDCKRQKDARNTMLTQCIRTFKFNPEIVNDTNKTKESVTDSMQIHPSDLDIEDYSRFEIKAIQNKAATIVQRYSRGFLLRLRLDRKTTWIKIFIGLVDDTTTCNQKVRISNKRRLEDLGERKEFEKQRNDIDYKDALYDLMEEVRKDEGFEMKQDLRAERITWVTSKIAQTNQVPESLEEFYESKEQLAKECERADDHRRVGISKIQSVLYRCIKDDVSKFNMLWTENDVLKREENNFSVELAKNLVVRDRVRMQIREIVDHELLTNLKRINDLDSVKKAKQSTGKSKKGKSGKSSKKKKEKGLPGDKFIEFKSMGSEDLMKKLVRYELLEMPRNISMHDLICSKDSEICSHTDGTYQPIPTISEVKRLIIEYGILPFGTSEIQRGIEKECCVRSILLFGPKGCGKTHIARAMAKELGALFIDLSPRRIPEEILHAKGGPTKLLHTVFTLAKDEMNSPVIIYLDECEKYFQKIKKKKKGACIFASKFQKELQIYKNQGILRHERIIVVGSSSRPWEADMNQLRWKGSSGKPEKQGFFEHSIYVPSPGYADRYLLWQHFVCEIVSEYKSISSPLILDYELLSRYSKGYSSLAIKDTIFKIISLEWMHVLDSKQLEEEMIKDLHTKEALQSDEEYKTFVIQLQPKPKPKP